MNFWKMTKKLICYTLDLEPDFGGRINSYSSLYDISYFQEYIRKNKIKLTTFAAGHIFKRKPDVIKKLLDVGSEIELHSYSHNLERSNEEWEIKKSKTAYINYFRKKPLGYRSPGGMITKRGFRTLAKEGFKYDSSIYPTLLPGRYNNLNFPIEPFYYKEFELVELPFSVVPKIRIPLAMGYLQSLGLGISNNMINIFGLPNTIIFDFHMWNLYKPSNVKNLPFKWKVLLARNLDKGMKIFQNLIKLFRRNGYKSITMKELYNISKNNLDDNKLIVY